MKFPNEWLTVRLGDVVTDTQPGFAQSPGEDETGIGQIRTHNVTPEGTISLNELKYVKASEQELEKYILRKGDVVFNNTNSEEWVGKTAYYDLEEALVFSNHMTRIRVNQALIHPEFLARYLHFLWKIGFSKTRAKRWVSQAGIDQRELVNFKLPLPPLPEQKRIVEILKQADALRRQRREILDQAKQLPTALFLEMFGDPDPRLNDKWEIASLGKVAKVETGGTPSRQNTDFYKGSIPWIKSTELKDERINDTEEKISEFALNQSNTKLLPVGTVLLAMYGQGQTRGRVGLLETPATCNQACAAILPNEDLIPEYLFIWFQCSYEKVRSLGRGGQQENLNLRIVRSLQIPKPPLSLQEEFKRQLSEIESLQFVLAQNILLYDDLLKQATGEAFTGELTESWRESHREELEAWLREHAELLGKRPAKIKIDTFAPLERKPPARPARRCLIDQLSEVQNQAYLALQKRKGTLIPSADLDAFLNQWPVEHLEDAHDQLRRALDQLAGLGLIAKVSLPTDSGDFVTGYRALRDEELSKPDDLERLGA